MTLNYRGLKYEVTAAAPAAATPRKGTYRGAAVDFSQIKSKPSAGSAMTYRGSTYTAA